MTSFPGKPTTSSVPRYRYSKVRWRVLVRVLDTLGALVMAGWRLFRRPPVVDRPARILLVQIDHLGDAVLTTAMLPHLKNAFPAARIDVLASPSNRAVFEANDLIDRVLVAERNWFDRRPHAKAWLSAVWSLGRQLRAEGYDLGIDVRGDVLTVLVLALARVPRRVGWTMGGGGFLLTETAAWVPTRHEVRSRLALLECIGVPIDGPVSVAVNSTELDRARVSVKLQERAQGTIRRQPVGRLPIRVGGGDHPEIQVVTRPLHRAAELEGDSLHAGRLGFAHPLLAVHLGAGTGAKRWPMSHWNRLLSMFINHGWSIVVVGGLEDLDASRALMSRSEIRDFTGLLTVTESVALLERADLFVGADSGPAHLAACARVRSVILFSGTNQRQQWRPWSRQTLVLRNRVGCSPCHQKECPISGHPCMAGIAPERVFAAALRWWSHESLAGMIQRSTG